MDHLKNTFVENFVIRLHSLLPSAIRTDNHTIPVVDRIHHGMVHESTTSRISSLIKTEANRRCKILLINSALSAA